MKNRVWVALSLSLMLVLSGCAQADVEAPISSDIMAIASATPTITVLQTRTVTPAVTVIHTATPVLTPTASISASDTPTLTPTPSYTTKPTSKPSPKPKPKPTPKPTKKVSATPTPRPTAESTQSPMQEPSDITPLSSSYKNAVLRGINYARAHNGEYAADPIEHLDNSLSAKAQKHAEEMAAKGDIFHSSWGPESVSCGNLSNGENAGVQSAVHAAGLLDPEISRIGVGAAKSADGTIYLCVDGGK